MRKRDSRIARCAQKTAATVEQESKNLPRLAAFFGEKAAIGLTLKDCDAYPPVLHSLLRAVTHGNARQGDAGHEVGRGHSDRLTSNCRRFGKRAGNCPVRTAHRDKLNT